MQQAAVLAHPHSFGNLVLTCCRCVAAVKQLTNTDPPRGKTSSVVFNARQRFRKTLLAVGQDLDGLKHRWGRDKLETALAAVDDITNQPGG